MGELSQRTETRGYIVLKSIVGEVQLDDVLHVAHRGGDAMDQAVVIQTEVLKVTQLVDTPRNRTCKTRGCGHPDSIEDVEFIQVYQIADISRYGATKRS